MKVLVFGGTGAIGTPVVDMLAKDGHEVYVTSRRERKTDKDNLKYIRGNAMDMEFVRSALESQKYDVLIDFMAYDTATFKERCYYLLDHVGRYFYFSSSRVYADNGLKPITEESARLLDKCDDQEYLSTDEYALAKARQENILKESGRNNWTIIRPYITYNTERLQLGVLEKEEWLYRALHGRTIVFTGDISSKATSLTYGEDSARRIVKLAEGDECGQVYHIATEEQIKWEDVLKVYVETLTEVLERPQKYKVIPDSNTQKKYGRYWQIQYDRLFDRIFNSSKVQKATGNMEFATVRSQLSQCLIEFVRGKHNFRIQNINWFEEGYFDKVCGEHTPFSEIPGNKNRIKYLVARYTNIQELRNKK